MGRSAKIHKRAPKKVAHASAAAATKSPAASAKAASSAPSAQEQKKRAGLKVKAGKRKAGEAAGPVLGGADYVELMLGSRRKAMAEAVKLPQGSDSD